MPSDWKMRKQDGGWTGDALDACDIRVNADGTAYELVGVLAVKSDNGVLPEPPFYFPEFTYQGLVWNIHVETFKYQGEDKGFGQWSNNAQPVGPPGEEDGTWTAQAGQGVESKGEEDAASASG
jgi:hypothetical protein